ncbi:MAG: hypothetical protein MUD08_16065 [Cytophagales bacterium]|nr:hypothetical protein [Cytophagales bacterium]
MGNFCIKRPTVGAGLAPALFGTGSAKDYPYLYRTYWAESCPDAFVSWND